MHRVLADAIVAIHLGYVAVVVLGLPAILIGVWRGWSWARNFWLRAIHLLMISVVAIQAIAGVTCPLTTWEYQLRVAAGDAGRPGTFVGRMVHAVLFFELPHWVFTIGYVGFGAAVLLAFLLAPPRRPAFRKRVPG